MLVLPCIIFILFMYYFIILRHCTYSTLIVRFLALVTMMVTKVDHGNYRSNHRDNHRR